jgi:hypothetical protein
MPPSRYLQMSWVISVMICLIYVGCESILGSNSRKLQIVGPAESVVYSSYSSTLIFHLLNWQVNNQVIESINSNQDNTFTAAHNQFSYLSL